MNNAFDRFAKDYDLYSPTPPEEYLNFIQSRFYLQNDDRVIDLGCGTGKLTLGLTRFSSLVEGLDSSPKMLELALSRDIGHKASWICCPVEKFNFGVARYRLIFAFEAFHLFRNTKELIQKCTTGLRKGGFLCIGWVDYGWELLLKEAIIKVFHSNGIQWGSWGYQSCSFFSDLVKKNGGLTPVVEEYRDVSTNSHISDIACFLASIEKAGDLSVDRRCHLIEELGKEFHTTLSSEIFSGISRYHISFCSKEG